MDYAYRFRDSSRLYLNVTNRCTCRCTFCVRTVGGGLGDGVLTGGPEPDLNDLLEAIEERAELQRLEEVVWCGFGEPTFRLDLILEASPVLREAGIAVRLNTNGHGNLIHGRDLLPELGRVLDTVSVSLNAPRSRRYLQLCRPDPGQVDTVPPEERFWETMLDLLARAPDYIANVHASVVGHALDTHEIEEARELAAGLGCRFRVR